MRHPWFKFYPGDWRADPALRMCSIAARGLWMEMVCLMHEAEPRGALMINGNKVDGKHLALLCGVSFNDILKLLTELQRAGVFNREDNGTIYSRRMRREAEKAEADKANGKLGGNPNILKGVNPPDNPVVQNDPNPDLVYSSLPSSATTLEKEERSEIVALAPAPRRRAKAQKTDFPPDWHPDIAPQDRAEFQRFRDYASAHSKQYADWPAAWRNWKTSPYRKAGAGNGKDRRRDDFSEALAELGDYADGAGASEAMRESGPEFAGFLQDRRGE